MSDRPSSAAAELQSYDEVMGSSHCPLLMRTYPVATGRPAQATATTDARVSDSRSSDPLVGAGTVVDLGPERVATARDPIMPH